MRKAKPYYTRRTAVRNQMGVAVDTGHQRNMIMNQPLDEEDEEDLNDHVDSAADSLSNDNAVDTYQPQHTTSFQTFASMQAAERSLEPNIVVVDCATQEQQFNAADEVEQAVYYYANQQNQQELAETKTSTALTNPVLISLNSCRLGRRLLRQLPRGFSQNPDAVTKNDVSTTTMRAESPRDDIQTDESFHVNTTISDHYAIETPAAAAPYTTATGNSSGTGTYKSVTTFVDKYRRHTSRETDLDSRDESRSSKRTYRYYCSSWLDECCSQSLLSWIALVCLVLLFLFIYLSVILTRRASQRDHAMWSKLPQRAEQDYFILPDAILELRPDFFSQPRNSSPSATTTTSNQTELLHLVTHEAEAILCGSRLKPWLQHVALQNQWFNKSNQHFYVQFSLAFSSPSASYSHNIRRTVQEIFDYHNQTRSGLFGISFSSNLIQPGNAAEHTPTYFNTSALTPKLARLYLDKLTFVDEAPDVRDQNTNMLYQKSSFDDNNIESTTDNSVSTTSLDDYWAPSTQANSTSPSSAAAILPNDAETVQNMPLKRNTTTVFPTDVYKLSPTNKADVAQSPISAKQLPFSSALVVTPSPAVFEVRPTLQCDASYTNNLTYHVQTPLYPKLLLPQSRWTMCIFVLPDICRVKINFVHFLGAGSLDTNKGSWIRDSVQIHGKVFTAKNWNGMTLWLDLNNSEFPSTSTTLANAISRLTTTERKPIQIVFTTDTQPLGNASLLVQQERCNIDNNASGFSSHYRVPTVVLAPVVDCRHQLLLNEIEQTLTSAVAPYFYTVPYANRLDCRTKLSNVPAHACGLNVRINHMSIEGDPDSDCAANDYLQIADTVLCGQKEQDETFLVPFSTARKADVPILWHTDASFSSTGFNISYGWIYSCKHV